MIRYFDYRPGYRRDQARIDAAIARVLASGELILGPEVRAFESELAAFLGVEHAIGVGSGTDALVLALRALGVRSGDEVITTSNSGVPPVAAVRAAGARPRLIDVLPESLLLDPGAVESAIGPRTRGVLAVHLYGHPVDLGSILEVTRAHGLWLIEDCAQALGARYRGAPVGGWGDLACFSFYPTKNLGAYGDGGAVVSRDRGLAERVRMLRMYGYRDDQHAHVDGLNSRLDELQAAILRVKLEGLAADNAERAALARRYLDGLAGAGVGLPALAPDREPAWHLFVIQLAERARVIEALRAHDVGYGIHYAEPVHGMEAYRDLAVAPGALPVSERACRSVLSLPLYPGLAPEDVARVIEIVRGS
jgi:dTDP-3-amino-2,3,6-trideoxy-4-keto-D-glucose/dTDP-3-amino-3,4,6-trideoxy-alpha-D-glucose/dTDP-2,6-dideoxy-D-kanosamine transaminase